MKAAAHRVSTAHLQAATRSCPGAGWWQGVYIGREVLGVLLCYDPWVLHARGVLTNP